jgi:tetratricopeptide (TPR) repeat protein
VRFLHGFSAGELFELLRPAVFLFSAILSAWVLASARRRGLRPLAVTCWTIGTLAAPPVVFPLHLAWRIFVSRTPRTDEPSDLSEAEKTSAPNKAKSKQSAPLIRYRLLLPLGYLLVVIAAGSFYFYLDSGSVDAHLSRANAARVMNDPERTIAEYRAALLLEDDAHTHNLLGRELAEQGRWDEALVELRVAKVRNEPDPILPYYLAIALEKNGQEIDARDEYKHFLGSAQCEIQPPDARCGAARNRLAVLSNIGP